MNYNVSLGCVGMDLIWNNIDWNWNHHPNPDAEAIKNASELLVAAKAADIFPERAGSGVFPSVRLLWRGGIVEVEVFQDCFELYFLPGADDKRSYTIDEFDAASPDALSKLIARISDILRTL
ncbi:hypothetical protein TRM7557_01823 [Tritonibacter multivorans]|uniref:Uncharacterized protein n=1 Tax=Tritonibacter multivorans TaxID=928856 RepID=A0A0N7LZQ5_9RHOB|nr:hypothetical protein [Tritonibacter multivorans]MDA7421284.1 hypothetical protein [Tritonibacter multivorans]CUH78321.1 hypothetical protein TRM7557_01823 [Tritonibacter multivorans]SFD71075.1 hypothetical protein SAMN04488049_12316 [Tritonibacter multivorans]